MSITSPFAGATGVFEEADYTSSGGDLAELKTYLLGRALWNPLAYTDDDAARDEREFLTAFYGAGAAPHIKQYMEISGKPFRYACPYKCFCDEDVAEAASASSGGASASSGGASACP